MWGTRAINSVIGVSWRISDCKWNVDRRATQIDPLPPPQVSFEGARVHRERITRTDVEIFGATAGCPGCNAIRFGERAQAHSDPGCSDRLNRRCEVLNEALAKEVGRNVRRRKEIESTAGELAAPQESKDVPIPPHSDPRKRRVTKAATAAASSGRSQMEGGHAVAVTPKQQNETTDESRMDVEGEERQVQKFDTTEHQTTNHDENIDGGEQH